VLVAPLTFRAVRHHGRALPRSSSPNTLSGCLRASPIVTSNKQFGRWGEVSGDGVVANAMTARLVHHAEVIASRATATGSKTVT